MAPKRLRILYIENTANVGGSVISLYELVRGLDASLYEPVVLFHGPNPYREQFQTLGVPVIVLNEQDPEESMASPSRDKILGRLRRLGDWPPPGYRTAKQVYLLARFNWRLARRVARLIKSEAIDLVHHNNDLMTNEATVIAARLAGVRQICHVRVLHTFSLLERYLSHAVDAFIYNSTAVEASYRRQGIPAIKGHVVYNAIDVETFTQPNQAAEVRAELGLREQDWVVANVGRLEAWKGQDYFLQAMGEVIQSQPSTKVLIVGKPNPGPDSQAYYDRLQQLVKDLQISEHVTFTGFRSDVPTLMAASDLVVHSSSEPEPFGRVVVEAMAAARPVIATAAGGILDIIENQVNGVLVPPKNATLMAKAILGILENPDQARKIGRRARRDVRERFSAENQLSAVQQIYESCRSKVRAQ